MPLLSEALTRARLSRVGPCLGKKILDLGCGHGEILEFLPGGVEWVTLVDVSPVREPLVLNRLRRSGVQGRFLVADLGNPLPAFPESPFDTIVMAAVLEHLTHPELVFRQLASLLSSHGKLIVTTPTSLGGKLHGLGSLAGLTYREAAEEHHQFLDEKKLRDLAMLAGFRRILYQRFLLNLNQLLVAEKE